MERIKKRYKWYRQDIGLWEERKLLFGIFPYYIYSLWKLGKSYKYIKLVKHKNPSYLKKAIQTNIYVGKKEFATKYKSNKHLVPTNFILNTDLP